MWNDFRAPCTSKVSVLKETATLIISRLNFVFLTRKSTVSLLSPFLPRLPLFPISPQLSNTHFWSPSLEHHSFCHISYASGFSNRRSLSIVIAHSFLDSPPNKQTTNNNFGSYSLKLIVILSGLNGWMRLVYSGLLLFIVAWNWEVWWRVAGAVKV